MKIVFVILLAFCVLMPVSCKMADDSGSSKVTVLAPTNLAFTKPLGYISFTWQDNATNETEFILYYKPFTSSSWSAHSVAIPTNATSVSVPISSLGGGVNFLFFLTAYDATDNVESAASNTVSVSLP